jgi:hypothetical protein
MPSEIREWSVPAPVRALLWWPAIAFALVVVAPDAGVGAIIVAGGVLAAGGTLLSMAAARLRRGSAAAVVPGALSTETTVEFSTLEMPRVTGERAA